MTSKPLSQTERLTRIETLLEAAVLQRSEDREAMRRTIEDMASDIRQIKADISADKADLAAVKKSGMGFLLGAAMAGGGIATGIGHFLGLLK